MEFFLKDTVEVRKVRNADAGGYFCDLHTGRQQKVGCDIQTIVIDILDTGHAHILLEKPHEIMLAEVDRFG